MPLPKRRHSKTRGRKRRTHYKLAAPGHDLGTLTDDAPAGVEPQKGISATQELAHQVLALHALNDYASGTTINVGVVRAGTRPNVVAAEAEAHVDVRVQTLAEAKRIDAAIRGLKR